MAEQVQNGSPYPPADGSSASQNLQQQPNPTPGKRNPRHRKQQSYSLQQIDGTVSDSVTHPAMSPRSKKAPKPRQQSVAMEALPKENGFVGQAPGAKARPVSVGANMLPATPAKEQAYAGPTFQASPAPSSLPVPKFFSRSVPNVAAQQKSLESRMAGERTPETEQSSPEPELVAPARDTQTSPLDMFFKADKAEKERSASLQSPEMRVRRAVPATEPRNPSQQSGKSVFLQELDGESDVPSARTVPHTNRPLPPQRMSSSDTEGMFPYSDNEREAATKSLKNLLFNVDAKPPPPRANSNPRNTLSPFETPSPFQRSASGPSTPTPPTDHYSLHYGHRANLSPLFKATRSDTPPARPSGLRQQELASDATSPTHPKHQQPPQIDPDSFSRNYLNQHIRASQPATFPPIPLPNGATTTNSASSSNAQPGSTAAPSSQHGVGVPGTGASPRTGSGSGEAGQDIRSMEDDLRRMLKINVLSN